MSKNETDIEDAANEFRVTEDYIRECIRLAHAHRDEAQKQPEVKIAQPMVRVNRDLLTGSLQVVESVEIELLREIIVKFSDDEVSEFQTMLPVHIKIKRKI